MVRTARSTTSAAETPCQRRSDAPHPPPGRSTGIAHPPRGRPQGHDRAIRSTRPSSRRLGGNPASASKRAWPAPSSGTGTTSGGGVRSSIRTRSSKRYYQAQYRKPPGLKHGDGSNSGHRRDRVRGRPSARPPARNRVIDRRLVEPTRPRTCCERSARPVAGGGHPDAPAVARALDTLQPSAVYHCAGIADVGGAWQDPHAP